MKPATNGRHKPARTARSSLALLREADAGLELGHSLFTTGHVGYLLGISAASVCKIISRGYLPAERVGPESRDRRVRREDLLHYCAAHGHQSALAWLTGRGRTVVLAGVSATLAALLGGELGERWSVLLAPNLFAAGLAHYPAALVLDAGALGRSVVLETGAWIARRPAGESPGSVRLVALLAEDGQPGEFLAAGFSAALQVPAPLVLARAIRGEGMR